VVGRRGIEASGRGRATGLNGRVTGREVRSGQAGRSELGVDRDEALSGVAKVEGLVEVGVVGVGGELVRAVAEEVDVREVERRVADKRGDRRAIKVDCASLEVGNDRVLENQTSATTDVEATLLGVGSANSGSVALPWRTVVLGMHNG
jgi:hypothetical protein